MNRLKDAEFWDILSLVGPEEEVAGKHRHLDSQIRSD
jgi:hypothetical protein